MAQLYQITKLNELTEGAQYSVSVNGEKLPVFHTSVADYAYVCKEGELNFDINYNGSLNDVTIRPIRYKALAKLDAADENTVRIALTAGDKIAVEPAGKEALPLMLCCKIPTACPADANIIYKSGEIYNIDELELKSGDSVYFEPGAIVCGCFHAEKAENISITGAGLLVGSVFHSKDPAIKHNSRQMVGLIDCKNINLSGFSMLDNTSWNVVPTACENVNISDLTIISIDMCGDGIDIVGSENVVVTDCFMRTNDDCFALKAVRYTDERGAKRVKNVHISKSVIWNAKCGNAIEIGYETSAKEICDVVFEDIDVIHCEKEGFQSGGVFTIHNGDRAKIHNVLYKNIRVEAAEEKLVDFKILSSKYSSDLKRGSVDGVRFEDIEVIGELPPSIIRGFENDFAVVSWIRNVHFKNLCHNGKPLTNQIDARMICELCSGIVFE